MTPEQLEREAADRVRRMGYPDELSDAERWHQYNEDTNLVVSAYIDSRERWYLAERFLKSYVNDDWRLVFRKGDAVVELSVTEEQWRAFDTNDYRSRRSRRRV